MERLAIISILSFLFTLIGTKYLKEYLEKKKIFDIPSNRSSHLKPIPKGGGWIIVLILIISILLDSEFKKVDLKAISLPLLSVLGLAVLSWIDDIKNLNVSIRLFFQFLIICTFWILNPTPADLGQAIIFTIISVWFINIFNFMDGIDGITPSVSITILLGYAIAVYELNKFVDMTFCFVIISSCFGFLLWNWHPAKIFLGDVGSITLGWLIFFSLLILYKYGKWDWALSLPMYYILDTSITLINRFIEGKKIWQAHNEHYYQKAVQSGMSHSQVVKLIIALQILIITTCYFIENPYLVVFLAFLQCTGLIIYFSSKYKKST